MKTAIELTVNDEVRQAEVEPQATLLELLRENLHLTGTKEGCGLGDCGTCIVLVDGKPVNSCLILAVDARGRRVTTIEGLQKEGKLHPLQQSFIDEGAVQCGFCSPAMILSAKALLDENPRPNEDEIKKALSGVLCRCAPTRKSSRRSRRPPRRRCDMETRYIGKSVPRLDALDKVTGRAVYSVDVDLPGMLHGALLRSPHPHARIVEIDLSGAWEVPGSAGGHHREGFSLYPWGDDQRPALSRDRPGALHRGGCCGGGRRDGSGRTGCRRAGSGCATRSCPRSSTQKTPSPKGRRSSMNGQADYTRGPQLSVCPGDEHLHDPDFRQGRCAGRFRRGRRDIRRRILHPCRGPHPDGNPRRRRPILTHRRRLHRLVGFGRSPPPEQGTGRRPGNPHQPGPYPHHLCRGRVRRQGNDRRRGACRGPRPVCTGEGRSGWSFPGKRNCRHRRRVTPPICGSRRA